jgi:hypothetical protein
MARLKKTSPALETARNRLGGFKSFKQPADLGSQLTIPFYEGKINAFATQVDAYNQALAALDQMLNELNDAEADLIEWNRRYLSATEAHYGPDSSEYELVGGTRKSDRKKPPRGGSSGSGSGSPPAS